MDSFRICLMSIFLRKDHACNATCEYNPEVMKRELRSSIQILRFTFYVAMMIQA